MWGSIPAKGLKIVFSSFIHFIFHKHNVYKNNDAPVNWNPRLFPSPILGPGSRIEGNGRSRGWGLLTTVEQREVSSYFHQVNGKINIEGTHSWPALLTLGEMTLFDSFWLKIWPYGVGVLLTFDFGLLQIPHHGPRGKVEVLIGWCIGFKSSKISMILSISPA